MLITDISIKRRITVVVLIAAIILIGAYSYITLPRESAPDVPIPIILITTPYEGVSPEDMETQVTIKIENELGGIKGLKELRSSSMEGMSSIQAEFHPEVDNEDALQRVRDKVDLAKSELPNDDKLSDPTITEINVADMPIIVVSIGGNIAPLRLKAIADKLEDAIEQIQGVLEVDVIGTVEREIRLEVDPDRMAAYDLTIADIIQTIPSENVNISAGGLETKGTKFNVRVPAELVDPAEASKFILTVIEGNPVYLTDVARVQDAFKDRQTLSRLNGQPNVTLNIKKRIGANIVEVADHVKLILTEARKQIPKGVELVVTSDRSKEIRGMISDLENNVMSALILVVCVLVLFMGFRTSAIVAIVIPLSMLMSFAIIQVLGITLNMVVLFSLILALGMLVDNAIVIVENIYRYMQMGHSRTKAAILGTREVAWPVTTSTATTVAAFAPMILWPGIMGSFMKWLPITVIIVLVSSLFVALIINPTISSVFASAKKRSHKRNALPMRIYRKFLAIVLSSGLNRITALILTVCLLLVLIFLYGLNAKVEFFPEIDPPQATIKLRSPQGTHLNESDRLARIVESRLGPWKEHVDFIVTNIGGGSFNPFGGGGSSGPHNANITLVFKDFKDRKRLGGDILKEVRKELSDIPGPELTVTKAEEGPPTGAAVTIRLAGEDFKKLEDLSRKIKDIIASVPGVINLKSDLEATRPELVFVVNRREAKLAGVDTASIGFYLQMAILGREVGKYRQFNDEYDITLRLPLEQRQDIREIERLYIPNRMGESVPIRSLGEFVYRGGFGTINRVDRKRVVTITGDAIEGESAAEVLKRVQEKLTPKAFPLPTGYSMTYAGKDEEQRKAQAFVLKALFIALIIITLILVGQFNSLTVPFVIMVTVLFSMAGVLLGLIICNMPFGIIMTGIGVVSLAGVVVNNAIVLLDYTRQLRDQGMDLVEAAVEAGATRLRPVMLTATTTILGLVPMAIGISFDFRALTWATRSESSQWWSSMAIAVIFGLAFATILTLVVVPTLYVTLMRITAYLGRFFRFMEHEVEEIYSHDDA
jgi:multidrug efflux pump